MEKFKLLIHLKIIITVNINNIFMKKLYFPKQTAVSLPSEPPRKPILEMKIEKNLNY